MTGADDFTDPPDRDPQVLLERDATIHDRIAAIGAEGQPLDALRAVARDTASPGVVRAAAILAIAARDESVELDTTGSRRSPPRSRASVCRPAHVTPSRQPLAARP